MSSTTSKARRYADLSIGFGGWTLTSEDGSARLSHYGSTWATHREEMLPGIIGVDLTAVGDHPTEALIHLSISGPMVCPTVTPGMIRGWGGERPLDPSLPMCGARSLDYVHPSDYAPMAQAIGARVFDPRADCGCGWGDLCTGTSEAPCEALRERAEVTS